MIKIKHNTLVIDVDKIPGSNANARNYPGLVLMNKKQCGDLYTPILAQEIFEARFKCVPSNFWNIVVDYNIDLHRHMEMTGQEISVQLATIMGLRDEKTQRRKRAYKLAMQYKQFYGMDWGEIDDMMLRRKGAALEWLESHGFF